MLGRLIRMVIAVAIVGGAAFGVYFYFFHDSTNAATVVAPTTASATNGSLITSFTTTGTAASTLTTALTFPAAGKVVSVSVGLGDKVVAGEELARLDDSDAQRSVATAAAALNTARLKYQQLVAPPATSDVATATQATVAARAQLAAAQLALDTAIAGPSQTDVMAADSSLLSAQNSLQNANNQVNSTFNTLVLAQRNYCLTNVPMVLICTSADIPLSSDSLAGLNDELAHPPGAKAADQTAVINVITALISANTSYLSAKAGVPVSQLSLNTAQAKRDALNVPLTTSAMLQLQSAVSAAQSAITSADAKLATLLAGATATDIATQQQAVDTAQQNYDTQVEALSGLVLRAPYDGVIGAASVSVGNSVTANTAAFTITDPNAIRVNLTVTESDFPNLKAGQFGIATFSAMPGNSYLIKVTAVSVVPTTTQGVVTYPVQALVLRATDLPANLAALQTDAAALATLGGARVGGAGANRTPGAGAPAGATRAANAANGTSVAGRTPQAGRTPPAGGTPGAFGGAAQGGPGGGAGAGSAAAFAALVTAPLPAAGMSANVTILLKVANDALLVPTAAVKRSGGTSTVTVVNDDGTTSSRTVVTGGTDSTNTAITSGLSEGEKVQYGGSTTAAASVTAGRTPTTGGNTFQGPPGGFQGQGGGAGAAPGGVR